MYIKVQDNKSLVVTVPTSILRGENKVDTLVFLVPSEYEGIKIADCAVMLRYIRPDNVGTSEQLKMLPEMYNGYLQYSIRADSQFTAVEGKLRLWLSAISLTDALVLKTSELVVAIKPSPNIKEFLPQEDLDQIDQLAMSVARLEATKADGLTYDPSDGTLQLTADGALVGDEVDITDDINVQIIDGGGASKQ